MTNRVYYLHSTVELPLEDVREYFDDPELPDEIDDIDFTRRNNTLIIRAIAPDGTVDKYTPTAQIKGTVTETRVPDEDAELPEPEDENPGWAGEIELEQEQPTKVIEMAAFKGNREAILQNSALQYPMFKVLRDLARQAETGTFEAIVAIDGVLEAVRIVDGEERPATIEIVEEHDEEAAPGVNWRNNEYISD